jgi:signal transduction histidine kinase
MHSWFSASPGYWGDMNIDVATVSALCLAQTALISALLVQRSRRRLAEHALRTSETALRSSYQEAQHLAGRLIAAQESERSRLARELHDNLSQKLVLLCMDIERLGLRTPRSPSAIAHSLDELLERSSDIASDVRCLAHDLHPPRLELVGLASAVEGLCRDVSRQCDVRVRFRLGALSRRVPPDLALCLFRITQESLQNVIKHSGASTATVRLTQTGQDIRLHITDTGKGFEPDSRKAAGFGLLSMRERVHYAGGRISIHASAGRGTRIVVTLPLNQEAGRSLDEHRSNDTHLVIREVPAARHRRAARPRPAARRSATFPRALDLRMPRAEPGLHG